MKTILENFLDALDISYTKRFTRNLFEEHPHKNNMYGLKKMLDVYGVNTLGVYVEKKKLSELNFPCILHTHGDFVIGLSCDANTIKFLQHGKETTLTHDVFSKTWTGNALVVQKTTNATEPDYKEHQRDELISFVKAYSIPVMLVLAVIIGLVGNWESINIFEIIRILLSCSGIFVCAMLMEKQLYGESRYGDRVCSLFHHADCSSVLDGPMAKVFGISWSEIGLGYFAANILLLVLIPSSSEFVTVINWIAMLYGIWSIYYQWCVAKSWCVLCIIVQTIIWAMGIIAAMPYFTTPFMFSLIYSLQSCIVFTISIVAVHQYASAFTTEKECVHAVQRYRALKANGDVAKALIEKSEYHETTLSDSSIIFGNPNAKIRLTILSNPHCNPCARMHKRVERLLSMKEKEICVQYIFSSFNETLEDSSRYLIYCYISNHIDEALRKLASWYAKDKFDYERILKNNVEHLHTEEIENEMEKHRNWRNRTSITATPTILVNGHILPKEYEVEDLVMIANINITEKNILQDINGRSTTPLGAESQSAEETVLLFNHSKQKL